MDDTSPQDPAALTAETFPAPAITAYQPLAPWWHSALLVLCFAVWAIISHFRPGHTEDLVTGQGRLLTYLSQIWLTWLILGATVAGLYHRHKFFRITLTQRARPWSVELRRGATAYLGLYAFAIIVLGALVALHTATFHPQPAHPASSERASAAPAPTKASPSPLTPTPEPAATKTAPLDLTHIFDNKAVRSLAPRTAPELLLWIMLSFTAAFVEEHIFRGYLLWQARVALMRASLPSTLATICAVALTSLLFGSLHLYEGIGAAAFITCLGALYCVLALRFANLRAVIVAHFLQDALAGLFIFVHTVRGGQ